MMATRSRWTRHARLATVVTILSMALLAGPANGAAAKSASVTTTFTVGGDGLCYAVSTASWSGYQVNRVRHIFKFADDPQGYATFTTTAFAKGSQNSGTMVSTSNRPVRGPGEGWFVHAIFRSNGGNHLAEADSLVAYAPAECPVPPPGGPWG